MKEDKPDPFTKEDIEILKEFADYMSDYRTLKKHRLECFNEQGMVTMVNKGGGGEELYNGRHFIFVTLDFFESQDAPFCYRICAELKKVLDEYDAKFPSNVST